MSMFRIVVAVSAFYAAVAERAYDRNTAVGKGEGKQDTDEKEPPTLLSAHFTCDADNEELSSCTNTQFSDDDHAETCWADEARQDCDKDSQGAYDLVMLRENSYCTYKALVKLGTFQGVTCKAVPADQDAEDDATEGDDRKQQVKDYMRDQIQSKLAAQGDDMRDQIQGKEDAQDDGADQQAHVKEFVKGQIEKKLAEKDARQQEVKAYMRNQIKNKLGGEEEEAADAEAYSGDPEDLEGGDMAAIEDLEKDLDAMNEFHDHDELMRKELEGLDLMDETVVEELGKYSEDLAKCMFRCIHSAHRYFSAEDAAKEACECTKTSSGGVCDECQYLSDDKIKDEEGNPIEAESTHAIGHLSEKHFQGKSSRGRCVLPGEVDDARKINFRGTVIQC